MSKTHFAELSMGNESNPDDEWSSTVCGLEFTDSPLSNKWEDVDCKKCLQRKDSYKKEMELAMEHNIRDMAGFMEFMNKQDK